MSLEFSPTNIIINRTFHLQLFPTAGKNEPTPGDEQVTTPLALHFCSLLSFRIISPCFVRNTAAKVEVTPNEHTTVG